MAEVERGDKVADLDDLDDLLSGSMTFTPDPLDPDDGRAPYRQVASSLLDAIREGRLRPGDQLPSQDALKQHYGLARATIQRALRELEDQGLTVARKGSGVYVRTRPEPTPDMVQALAWELRVDPVRLRQLLVKYRFLVAEVQEGKST